MNLSVATAYHPFRSSIERPTVLTEEPIRDPLTGGQPRFNVQAHSLAARRSLRVLLVGRRATGDALAAMVAERAEREASDTRLEFPDSSLTDSALTDATHTMPADASRGDGASQDDPSPLPSLEVVALTNQKMALQEIRMQPPKVVLVELEDKQESRRRFCEMVRYRLPTAMIFAVGMTPPRSTFVFDGVLQLPLRAEEVWAALQSVQDDVDDYVLQRGPIRLNLATRTVTSVNGARHMTPKQCALLQFLMLRTNQVASRREIMESIWETNYLEDTRTLDVHIRWLRECIEPDPSTPVYLLTERGKGYYLSIPVYTPFDEH